MSRLTTHVLDTMQGKPAAGITVIVYRQHNNGWEEVVRSVTDSNGRIANWLDGQVLASGIYKLVFETGAYFNQAAIATFYPVVEVTVAIADEKHYHVPLLLSAFGYSTYRGS
jgi:5-hydroxyisourate hydrolase